MAKSKNVGGKGMKERGYKAKVIYFRPGEMDRIKRAARLKGKDASAYIVETTLADADATIANAGVGGQPT